MHGKIVTTMEVMAASSRSDDVMSLAALCLA